ncbi:hypothetical protein [Luteolibacter sp. LG18]|uniref:hypothetical protein n=1 Tax=Luteolibacter sp. LG18 TaxID=2819286 RepID=UPI002B30A4DB|nr:hypothetical protein llg_38730 [Luteolibacter sp. LG18]
MDPDQQDDFTSTPFHASHAVENKPSIWKKLGGGSLSISIIVHAILLAIGVVWIFQIIPAQEPKVDFMPKGGGGGSAGVKEVSNKKQRATMTTPNMPRMAAKGVASSFTLPEPDAASSMSSVGSLSSGGLSGGLGGSGSGGGRGDGHGTGFGSGMGPGLGGGAAGSVSPFGLVNPNANALVGEFYDTKQDTKRKPTDITPEKLGDLIQDFTRSWNDRILEKYYKAPQKLYLTKLFIPTMSANEAPKAYKCENEVEPSRWMAIYRGNVIAPKTGKFRFVGAGDDILMVRFNRKTVFDWGYTFGSMGGYSRRDRSKIYEVLSTGKGDKEAERNVRSQFPTRPGSNPISYEYPSTGIWNKALHGLGVGPEFDVTAGTTYPIEILISELPGGLFGAALMIEEVGATYQKAPNGSPILPIFRTDGSQPAPAKGECPPYDPQGPIWKAAGGSTKDI